MVSSYVMLLVKKDPRSKLFKIQLGSKLTTLSVNRNDSWTSNSFTVKANKILTKNFAKLYVSVSIIHKMDYKEI